MQNLKYHGKICHECLMGDLRLSEFGQQLSVNTLYTIINER